MARRDVREELDRKRKDLKEKGKKTHIGKPYETDRDLVEEGERKRPGTNLDLGEERSGEQRREMRRWRRE